MQGKVTSPDVSLIFRWLLDDVYTKAFHRVLGEGHIYCFVSAAASINID